VTDRQRTEQELVREHDLLQALLDNSPDYIFFKDAESRILRSNKAHAELLGFADPQEAIGKTDFDLFPADDAQRYYDEEQQIIQSGQPVIDRVGQTPDSESKTLWLSETKIPLTDETGQKSGLFGISRNITERKLAEEKLAKRAAELQAIADINMTTTAILERDQLLREVSNLTKERFDLYHAHIYLLDELGETLTLVAGAGDVGQQMVSEDWSIPIDQEQSLVAQVARTGEGVIVNDVQQNPHHLPNPLLPDTRSEMAVPLIVGGMVLGVLDVQSDRVNRFTQEDVQLKTALASQVAVALQNAEQYEFAQQASHLLGKRVQELNCLNEIGREMEEVPPLDELLQWVTERIPRAMQYPDLCETAIKFDDNVYGVAEAIDLPAQMTHGLYIRGDVMGRMYIAYTEKHDFLNEESAMLGAVATRLSGYIENQRLLEETGTALSATEALARERAVLTELGRALTSQLDVDQVLEETYRQTSHLIDTTNFYVGLYDPEKAEISFPLQVSESQIDLEITVIKADQGLAGYMVRNRTGLLFEDNVRAQQEALGITMVGEEALSWLGVPLMIGDEVLGVMAVQSHTTPRLYGEHERELLTAIANQVAIALQNARHFEQTQTTLAEVQQSQELLGSIIDATPDWIFIKDQEHRYRLVNQGYADALHMVPDDFIGKNDLELGFPEELVKGNPEKGIRGFWADDRLVMDSGETQVYPSDPAMIDGELHTFHTIKTPLRDARGEIWGVLAFGRDVTEREQLLSQTEMLYQASTELNTAQTYEEILTILRQHTLLGQGSQSVSIGYFEQPWTDEERHHAANIVARWSQIPTETFKSRYYSSELPGSEQLLWADQAVTIEDVATDPRMPEPTRSIYLERFKAKSVLFAPLLAGGQWVGYITAAYAEPTTFPEVEMRRLRALSGQAAVAVQSMHRLGDTEGRVRREQTIREITDKMRAATNLEQLVQTAAEELGQRFSADYALVDLGFETSSTTADPQNGSE